MLETTRAVSYQLRRYGRKYTIRPAWALGGGGGGGRGGLVLLTSLHSQSTSLPHFTDTFGTECALPMETR